MTTTIDPATLRSISNIHITEAADAFRRVKPRADKVPDEELLQIRTDVTSAVSIAVGAVPAINEMVPEIRKLYGFDPENATELLDYALGAWQANALYLTSVSGTDDVQRVAEEAVALRDRGMACIEMLAKFGVVPSKIVGAMHSGNGYLDTATDLNSVANVLRENWSNAQGKTPLTEADLTEMQQVATTLMAVVAVRNGTATPVTDAAKTRQRMYTLFVRAYEQVRRAATYLRADKGDADSLVPSLFQHDTSSPKKTTPVQPAGDASSASRTANPTTASPSTQPVVQSAPVAKSKPTATTPSPLPPGSSVKEGGPFTE